MASTSRSFVWEHFSMEGPEKAVCMHCGSSLRCGGASTSSLIRHLSSQHKIVQVKKEEDSGGVKEPPKKKPKQLSITAAFQQKESLQEVVARLAAEDNISINVIATSKFIREALRERGFLVPKDPGRVMLLVKQFHSEVMKKDMDEIARIKKEQKKFAITLDEYTSLRNRRYLNITLHCKDAFWDLGMIRIQGKCTADKILDMVACR